MICPSCKGSNEECGCGTGKCDHCNNGVITDPPFGPLNTRYCEELEILSSEDFAIIINYDIRCIHEQIAFIPEYMGQKNILTQDEIKTFQKYWDDPYRDETLGNVLNRVAWLVNDRIKQ